MSCRCVVPVLAILVVPAALRAQSPAHVLAGRHQVTLFGGLHSAARTAAEVSVPGVTVASSATGAFGGIGYAYWPDERISVIVRGSAMEVSAEVSVSGSGTSVEAATVAALQLGARYQFAATPTNALRPHLAVSVGPLFGSGESVTAGLPTTVTTVNQAVISGQLALGAELSLGRSVTLGVDAGYFFAADFDQFIGARENYSSPVLAFSLGVLIGRGRAGSGR